MSGCLFCINWALLKSAIVITSRAWLSRKMTTSRKYILAVLPFASKSETSGCECCLVKHSHRRSWDSWEARKTCVQFLFYFFPNKQETLLYPSQFLCRINHLGIMSVTSLCSRRLKSSTSANYMPIIQPCCGWEACLLYTKLLSHYTSLCLISAIGTEHWAGCFHGCSNLCVQTWMRKAFSL